LVGWAGVAKGGTGRGLLQAGGRLDWQGDWGMGDRQK
jgi:hypothetical protein